MKSKTLAIITATLITVAALILTASLSLLNGAAIDISDALVSAAESVSDNGIADDDVEIEVNIEDTNDVEIDNDVDEEIYVETEEAPVENETVENETPVADTRLPALDTLEVVKEVDENGGYVWEYVLWKDIVIDVFEHSTGKLVGQVWIDEDEIYSEFCKIFNEDFDYTAELFDPNDPEDVPVFLPEAKYRVEFHWVERLTANASGSVGAIAFSYGVENNEIFEFVQTGYPLGNGETVIAYMEALVAEKIAQLESGINDSLNADDSFATVIGMDGEDGYWDGWTDPYTGERYPGVDRYTERFPYIQE